MRLSVNESLISAIRNIVISVAAMVALPLAIWRSLTAHLLKRTDHVRKGPDTSRTRDRRLDIPPLPNDSWGAVNFMQFAT